MVFLTQPFQSQLVGDEGRQGKKGGPKFPSIGTLEGAGRPMLRQGCWNPGGASKLLWACDDGLRWDLGPMGGWEVIEDLLIVGRTQITRPSESSGSYLKSQLPTTSLHLFARQNEMQ